MISLVDAHCDTIVKLHDSNKELFENDAHIDLKKLSLYKTPLQFFAIFLNKSKLETPFVNTLSYIDFFHEQVNKYSDYIVDIGSYEDYIDNKENGLASALLSLEGAEALENSMANLNVFYELGVRSITLTWNRRNSVGDGAMVKDGQGLTEFGKKVITKMNALGMIIDVSHLNELGFWDVFGLSEKPFIASHSNSFTIKNHPRNLKDEQIKAIAKNDGVIGINIYDEFVNGKGSTIEDLLKHIDYMLYLVGDEHIGLGCDFDGIDSSVEGLDDISDMIKVYQNLVKKYGEATAEKIFSKNFERVLKEVL